MLQEKKSLVEYLAHLFKKDFMNVKLFNKKWPHFFYL